MYTLNVESSWNVMAHGDAREGKWRGNWRMEWVASTLHTTSELDVSSITTADAHTSAASSRLNWRPCRLKWTRPFRRKTKSGFCACAITFQTHSTSSYAFVRGVYTRITHACFMIWILEEDCYLVIKIYPNAELKTSAILLTPYCSLVYISRVAVYCC